MSCENSHWQIDPYNVGHCSNFEDGFCSLSKEICPLKGTKDFDLLQSDIMYGNGTYKREWLRKSVVRQKIMPLIRTRNIVD